MQGDKVNLLSPFLNTENSLPPPSPPIGGFFPNTVPFSREKLLKCSFLAVDLKVVSGEKEGG